MGLILSLCTGPSMPRVQYEFLALTRLDIAQLSRVYCAMKRNKNGFVDISRVLKYFKMDGNEFMEGAFMLFNRDEAKEFPLLNFEEFVYLTWNFCSCHNLAFLAFSVYDTDRQNDLNADEADVISRAICGSNDFSSLKSFVPMKFTGINNSHYSQYLKANPSLLEKLNNYQTCMQKKTLGLVRWKAVAQKRNLLSSSSTFIDLFDVLKLLAVRKGVKRDFVSINRHFILKDEKRKNKNSTPKVAPTLTPKNNDISLQLEGYSEPMQRWLRDKMSSTGVRTHHPIYQLHDTDYDQESDIDGGSLSLKSVNESASINDSSMKSEMGRLERKLTRQNSVKSRKSNTDGAPSRNKKPRKSDSYNTKNIGSAEMSVDSSEDSDNVSFTDFKPAAVVSTPYRRQSRHDASGKTQYRHSL